MRLLCKLMFGVVIVVLSSACSMCAGEQVEPQPEAKPAVEETPVIESTGLESAPVEESNEKAEVE